MSYSSLKSGTDIRGFAADGFENELTFLSDEKVEKIAVAFAMLLEKRTDKKLNQLKISVGHDSRISAQRIKSAILKALTFNGIEVADCSLASTPAMFMSVLDLNCDGAIQITASHHPWERNGLKFFTPNGGVEGSDISEILSLAQDVDNSTFLFVEDKVKAVDYMSEYAQKLRDIIKKGVNAENYDKPLEGVQNHS